MQYAAWATMRASRGERRRSAEVIAFMAPALLALACSPPPRPVPAVPPAAPVAQSDDASSPRPDASAGASPEVSVSPEMERLLAESERLEDPVITFSRVAQTPPPRRYAVARRGHFPVREAAHAVIYTFGWSLVPGACGPDEPLPFTRAGTLCPEVVSPGVVLDADEIGRVTALLSESDAALAEQKKSSHWSRRAVTRCDFEPHHVVAFYDARGVVLGQILVCFTCGEWQVTPGSESLGGGDPAVMTPDERASLAALFDAHGLAAWRFGSKNDEVMAYERAVDGTPREPTKAGLERRARRLAEGSGAPPSSRVRDLGVVDRQKLCDWSAHRVEPTGEAWRERGYRCDDGRTWTTTATVAACATAPVSCDRTVAEIEACLRVYREPEDLCSASPPPQCAGLLDCLPGIVLRGDAGR
jgi:hypothetical protein